MIAFAWGLDRAAQDCDPGDGEHGVEGGGELRVPVAEQELDGLDAPVEVHQQVAAQLCHPSVAGMRGHAEDADPAGGVLDDGQNVGGGAVEQLDGEEVGSQDRLRLTVQKLRPRRARSSQRRWDPGVGQDLPHRRGSYLDAEAGELTVDPPVTPAGTVALSVPVIL